MVNITSAGVDVAAAAFKQSQRLLLERMGDRSLVLDFFSTNMGATQIDRKLADFLREPARSGTPGQPTPAAVDACTRAEVSPYVAPRSRPDSRHRDGARDFRFYVHVDGALAGGAEVPPRAVHVQRRFAPAAELSCRPCRCCARIPTARSTWTTLQSTTKST